MGILKTLFPKQTMGMNALGIVGLICAVPFYSAGFNGGDFNYHMLAFASTAVAIGSALIAFAPQNPKYINRAAFVSAVVNGGLAFWQSGHLAMGIDISVA